MSVLPLDFHILLRFRDWCCLCVVAQRRASFHVTGPPDWGCDGESKELLGFARLGLLLVL